MGNSIEEIWQDIIGWEGYYQISNLFRVKSVKRVIPHKTKGTKTINERVMKQRINSDGYVIYIFNKNFKSTPFLHHRLIGLHFIKNPENKPQINHKNGIRDDNRIDNLEWVTIKENQVHSWKHLNRVSSMKGRFWKDNPKSKMVKCSTLELIFSSTSEASNRLGLNQGSISSVCNGKRVHTEGLVFNYI